MTVTKIKVTFHTGQEVEFALDERLKLRNIYFMAGIENIAYYDNPDKKFLVKTTPCNECGKCCMALEKHPFPVIDGTCLHIKQRPGQPPTYHCALAGFRPFKCSVADPTYMEDCVIQHHITEIK